MNKRSRTLPHLHHLLGTASRLINVMRFHPNYERLGKRMLPSSPVTFNRRSFLSGYIATLVGLSLPAAARHSAEIAITMDDPKPDQLAGLQGTAINRRILNALHRGEVAAALFVTGMRIANPAGAALIREWDSSGHLICTPTIRTRTGTT